MPLPDAPPVETSRIYQQFKGLNALGNVTGAISSDLMDNIRLQQFVDFNSEDELRRMLLVGLASQTMSAAGPIANTGRIEVITSTAIVHYWYLGQMPEKYGNLLQLPQLQQAEQLDSS